MARYDVGPHLIKWWKKVKPEDGQVIRQLSPYEQQVLVPWLKTWPKRTYEKASDSMGYVIATAVIVLGTATWADATDAAIDREHRY